MNICIIGQYPPQIGGVSTYTKQLEDYLTSHGHNVYILTYPQNCDRKDNVFEVNVIDIPILRALSFIIFGYFKLKRIIKEYDIDVVHSNYLIPPGFVSSLINMQGVKKVATAHGSDINVLSKNIILRHLLKYTINHTDEVYFVSEKLKETALKLNIDNLDKKSYITPNTVDTDKFKPIDKSDRTLRSKYNKPIVMFIGNLVKQKGLIYLLEAKRIAKSDYALLIYGDGVEKETLKRYIQENELKDVYLMGQTTTPEKMIPESDVMVLSSLSEGASIIALESMSCAKALVATDTGNISRIITNNENGVIVSIKNPQELSSAIDELILNPDKCEEMGKKARQSMMNMDFDKKIPYIEN